MSVVAHVTVPAEGFVLGRVLEVGEDAEVRLESMVPTGRAPIPSFWVGTGHATEVAEALDRSSVVSEVRIVEETEDETLFQVKWSTEVNGLIDALGETDGVVLRGTGNEDNWSFRLRFPDHDDLSAFYRRCLEAGISVDLQGVQGLAGDHNGRSSLTQEQYEALRLAFEGGYFTVPRRVTLVELADELGVSDTAASQRLRRGLNTVLATSLDANRPTRNDSRSP